VAYVVSQVRDRGAAVVEPTEEAEAAYVQEVRSLARMGRRFYEECTPGYYNSEGAKDNRAGFFSDMYGAGPLKFFQVLEGWRATGEMPGLEVR
jgi:cyclohexanone monooxygenase